MSVTEWAWDRGNFYMLFDDTRDKYLRLDGHSISIPPYARVESVMNSEVQFGDFTGNYWTAGRGYGNPSRKGSSKVQLRVTLDAGATLGVYMRFDGGDETEEILVRQLTAGEPHGKQIGRASCRERV